MSQGTKMLVVKSIFHDQNEDISKQDNKGKNETVVCDGSSV